MNHNAEAHDAVTRQRIVGELDKNFMIEAAAGTGKTTSMVNRMVSLIARGTCSIDQLVAVTFTRKAAAELRERFQAKLRQQASELQVTSRGSANTKAYNRLCEARDHSARAFVGTIHSFCASLLRERPLEFGVEPAFRELDEQEDLELREQAWQENIQDLLSVEDPMIAKLKELGIDRQKIKQQFHRLIDFRDVENWPHSAPPKVDLANIQQETRKYIAEMQQLLPLFPKQRGRDTLMQYYEDIVRSSDRTWRREADFFRLLEKFDSSHGTVQKQWHSKPVAKSESQRWDQFRQDLVKPTLEYWYRQRYQAVVEFLRRAVAVYEQLKTACGGLDFNDLLLTAARGLKSQSDLRTYFQSRYSHVLVDEFQDTDPIQAELILYLTADSPRQRDWMSCVPRRGSLFAVGDPKQSIYRFRRGDIVTYNKVKEIFRKSGGEVLPLVKNFRSGSELIEWNNSLYSEKFPEKANRYAAAAEEMVPGREDVSKGEFAGVYKLRVDTASKIDVATEQEAEAIARFIHHAIGSGLTIPRTRREIELGRTLRVEAVDFLIITHGKKRISYFKQALDRYEIPNQVTGDNALLNVPQLDCLIDILRCVDDPLNSVHLLSVLRDRMFGFSDQELYSFKRSGGRFQFTTSVPNELDVELKDRFQRTFDRLRRYQGWLRSLPFTAAVHAIAEDLGLLAAAATGPEGNIAAGALMKAIECLRQQSYKFDSASDLITFFEQLAELSESEGCTALPPDANVVRVMNLHKAKGLEAPIVFLADTTAKFNHPVSCHIDRSGRRPAGYIGITEKKGKWGSKPIAVPESWGQIQQKEQDFLDAEADRLLYVATTRAAGALIVSTGREKSHWGDLHGYLSDAPELTIPSDKQLREVPCSSKPSPLYHRSKTGLPSVQHIADRWTAAGQSSFSISTAKDLGLKGVSRPHWETSGEYGYRWGSALHELLEICHNSPDADLRSTAATLAKQHDLGSERVQELIATAQSVIRSEIWQRSRVASRSFSELPFEAAIRDELGRPAVVRGVIDLIFEEREGWVIVDYKSDDLPEKDLATAVAYYRSQLDQYAQYWKDLTKSNVVERGLYFTRTSIYKTL